MEKITIKTGAPVDGKDFYGRERKLEEAWECLTSKGTSLLLSAPRRVGKTSFSRKMLKLAEEKGWKTLYLDLQGIGTEGEFVKLFEELKPDKRWNKTGNFLGKIFGSIKSDTISIDLNVWRNDSYGKIKQSLETAGEILIVIDELTIYLNHLFTQQDGREKVEFFLEWLRHFRQIPETKVRWIFCSSVGIDNFASMHQMSKHFNDLHRLNLDVFSNSEAKDFISRLDVNEKVQFTDEHIQYILDKLAWYLPYFIQLLIDKINSMVCYEEKQLSNDTIDEAYNCLITENYFITWGERLKEYGELEDNAYVILKQCASAKSGRSRDNLIVSLSEKETDKIKIEKNLASLLSLLQNDGYLMEFESKYFFRSPLLRDFWYKRYVR